MTLWSPEFIQPLKYRANRLRMLTSDAPLQEGVVSPWSGSTNPFKVRPTSPASMAVDIEEGAAYVRGDALDYQGLYHVVNDATVTVNIPPNSSGLPRVDMIVVTAKDSVDASDADDVPVFQVITGTPTSGATVNNELGLDALPDSSLLLATVAVPSGAATIPANGATTSIVDRRAWAYGAKTRDLTGSATTPTIGTESPFGGFISGTPFIELGELAQGVRFRGDMVIRFQAAGTTAVIPYLATAIGHQYGTHVSGGERRVQNVSASSSTNDQYEFITVEAQFSAAPGRYHAYFAHKGIAGTAGTMLIPGISCKWMFEEMLGSSDWHSRS